MASIFYIIYHKLVNADGGVVFGLSYGLICLGVYTVKALQGTLPNVPPDLPTE